MGKGKSDVWTAIFSAELKPPQRRSLRSLSLNELSPPWRFRLGRSLLDSRRTHVVVRAALLVALLLSGIVPTLAEKGGRGHHRHHGVPSVNLELSQFPKGGAGAGPFVVVPPSFAGPLQPGNGLAVGRTGNKPMAKTGGGSPMSDAAPAQIEATTEGHAIGTGDSAEILPTTLPTCR